MSQVVDTTRTSPKSAPYMWNGPVCQRCGRGYLSSHTCSPDDLIRKAQELLEAARMLQQPQPTRSCPCDRRDGRSTICMNVACPFAAKITC